MGFGKAAAYEQHRRELAEERRKRVIKTSELLSKGYSLGEIANHLDVGSNTVRDYIREIRSSNYGGGSSGIFPFNVFGWFFGSIIFMMFCPIFIVYYFLKIILFLVPHDSEFHNSEDNYNNEGISYKNKYNSDDDISPDEIVEELKQKKVPSNEITQYVIKHYKTTPEEFNEIYKKYRSKYK